jgi:hypothetical protein
VIWPFKRRDIVERLVVLMRAGWEFEALPRFGHVLLTKDGHEFGPHEERGRKVHLTLRSAVRTAEWWHAWQTKDRELLAANEAILRAARERAKAQP